MARRISLVVLCEDEKGLGQSFAAAFLNRYSLPVRLQPIYRKGPNKPGVLRQFPDEVRTLLRQGAETHLLVLMDADDESYERNLNDLLKRLTSEEKQALLALNRFHLICPNYELENWCRHLEGRLVTEARDLSLTYKEDSDCRDAARFLADCCRGRKKLPEPSLPSLGDACKRWQDYTTEHDLA